MKDFFKTLDELHKELWSPLRTQHTRMFYISGLKPFELTFYVIWSYDSNYGADADGRRGRGVYTPTDTEFPKGSINRLNKVQLIEFNNDIANFLDVLEAP